MYLLTQRPSDPQPISEVTSLEEAVIPPPLLAGKDVIEEPFSRPTQRSRLDGDPTCQNSGESDDSLEPVNWHEALRQCKRLFMGLQDSRQSSFEIDNIAQSFE